MLIGWDELEVGRVQESELLTSIPSDSYIDGMKDSFKNTSQTGWICNVICEHEILAFSTYRLYATHGIYYHKPAVKSTET